jgi:dihydrofolate reductase
VIKGDLVEEVTRIRDQDGDIMMHGFGPVAQTLIRNGLLDVLHLWVHPQFAGVGAISGMLFSEGNNTRLELIAPRILSSGIVMLSCRVPGPES